MADAAGVDGVEGGGEGESEVREFQERVVEMWCFGRGRTGVTLILVSCGSFTAGCGRWGTMTHEAGGAPSEEGGDGVDVSGLPA